MQTQPGAQSAELRLSRAEWELLVRLPRHVMLAAAQRDPEPPRDPDSPRGPASPRDPDSPRGPVAAPDTTAADAAVDAGRDAASRLVQGVVAVIRSGDVAAASYTDRAVDQAGVLSECHIAAQLLHDRLPLADATAYEDWLLSVAGSCAPDTDFLDGLKRALTFT